MSSFTASRSYTHPIRKRPARLSAAKTATTLGKFGEHRLRLIIPRAVRQVEFLKRRSEEKPTPTGASVVAAEAAASVAAPAAAATKASTSRSSSGRATLRRGQTTLGEQLCPDWCVHWGGRRRACWLGMGVQERGGGRIGRARQIGGGAKAESVFLLMFVAGDDAGVGDARRLLRETLPRWFCHERSPDSVQPRMISLGSFPPSVLFPMCRHRPVFLYYCLLCSYLAPVPPSPPTLRLLPGAASSSSIPTPNANAPPPLPDSILFDMASVAVPHMPRHQSPMRRPSKMARTVPTHQPQVRRTFGKPRPALDGL